MSKIIRALYTAQTIRVYQAYNDLIADEALDLQKFGSNFKMSRMTWIKPSFLWMMYRSGWATKANQTRILAIDMLRVGFDKIVNQAVCSSFHENKDLKQAWAEAIRDSQARVQWDPERDIYGKPIKDVRSIQLGIRGDLLRQFNNEWIVNISDITEFVLEQSDLVKTGRIDQLRLPDEKEYLVLPETKI